MLKLQYIICFLLCINSAFSQDWEEVESIRSTNFLKNHRSLLLTKNVSFLLRSDGLYRSLNNGESWSKQSYHFNNRTVLSITNIDSLFYVTTLNSVYQSTDYGLTWNQMLKYSNSKSINSGSQSTVIECNKSIYVQLHDALFTSTDFGQKWTRMEVPITSQENFYIKKIGNNIFLFSSMNGTNRKSFRYQEGLAWVSVDNSLIINELHISARGYIYTTNGKEVYRSNNYGDDYEKVTTGMLEDISINDLLLHRDCIYASTNVGLYRSTNDGDTWQLLNTTTSSKEYILMMYSTVRTLFVATYNDTDSKYHLKLSTDQGSTWEYSGFGMSEISSYESLPIINQDDAGYLSLTKSGMYRSKNGKTWSKIENVSISPVINSIYKKDSTYYIVTEGNLYTKSSKSDKWLLTLSGKNISPRIILSDNKIYCYNYSKLFSKKHNEDKWEVIWPLDTNQEIDYYNVYVSGTTVYLVKWQEILQSKNEGETWENITLSLPNRYLSDLPSSFFVSDSTLVLGSTNFVNSYISNDHGTSWKILSNNIPTVVNFNGYFISGFGAFSISSDNGLSWKEFNYPQVNKIQSSIFQSGSQLKDVLLAQSCPNELGDFSNCDSLKKHNTNIYTSSNHGTTWNKSTYEEIQPYVYRVTDSTFYLMAYSNKSLQYLDNSLSLFRSIDNGKRWMRIASALRKDEVYYGNSNYEIFTTIGNFIPTVLFEGDTTIVFTSNCGLYKLDLKKIDKPQITTSYLNRTQYCTGDYIEIDYKVERSKSIPKDVWIELSDEYGDFDHATKLTTLSRVQGNKLISSIPLDTKPSEYYRLRVATSDSSFYLLDNGHDIQINPQSTVMAINGPDTVSYLSSEIVYFVDYEDGAKYEWEIVSGNAQLLKQSQNIIGLSFGISGTVVLRVIKTNKYGCISKDMISISIQAPTNIDDENLFAYSVWPNPSSGSEELSIRFSQAIEHDIELEFVDLLGTVHATTLVERGRDASSLPIQHVQSGVYMLRMKTQNQVFIEKVIVQ